MKSRRKDVSGPQGKPTSDWGPAGCSNAEGRATREEDDQDREAVSDFRSARGAERDLRIEATGQRKVGAGSDASPHYFMASRSHERPLAWSPEHAGVDPGALDPATFEPVATDRKACLQAAQPRSCIRPPTPLLSLILLLP
jgi:hypothetical protein